MAMSNKKTGFLQLLKRLVKSDRGNVSIMAGLAAVPLFLAGGAAIDYERAINTKTMLQAALDSAALYAASLPSTNDEYLTNTSKPYVTTNYNNVGEAALMNYSAHYVAATSKIQVSGQASMKTWFMSIVGQTDLVVTATSEVQRAGINLEVSLVLDNTTSMNTGGAIASLRDAAKKFVNQVMPATQGVFYTKIAVVPYNNSVNLGPLAVLARGGTQPGTNPTTGTNTTPASDNFKFKGCTDANCSGTVDYTLPITTCVTERTGSQAYTDAAVSSYPVGRAYLAGGNGCNAKPLVPLSTSASTLTTLIDSMTASGSTAGQVGIAWGWYALSPTFGLWTGASVPASYSKLTTSVISEKVTKVMIIMTDGEYNSAASGGVITGLPTVLGSGGYNDHINKAPDNGDVYTQSNNMCNAIKASGVEVYVISFQLDKTKPQRVALINNCATDAAHVIDGDTQSLDSAFSSIANKLLALRITG